MSKISKAKADAQAKRDKFLEAAKDYRYSTRVLNLWRKTQRGDRERMDHAHQEYLSVEHLLK